MQVTDCLFDAPADTLTVVSVGVKTKALAHELAMDEKAPIGVDANGLGRRAGCPGC